MLRSAREAAAASAQHFNLYHEAPVAALEKASALAEREGLLRELEQLLRKLLLGSPHVRGELRSWLAATLAEWEVPANQRDKLARFAENEPFRVKLMDYLVQKYPQKVATLLEEEGPMFRRFFREHPEKVLVWFDHFHYSGHFEKGAAALEKYSLNNREEFWDKLKWKYSTVPSPIVIVHQKIRFLEMDLPRTVAMLVESEPEFWDSAPFRESLRDGAFLQLDPAFFARELAVRIRWTQVHRLAETSLRNEPFKELIPRLLPALCDADVLYLLYQLNPNTSRVEQVLLTMCKWPSLDDVLLCNALYACYPRVSRLIEEESAKPEGATTATSLATLLMKRMANSEEESKADALSFWSLFQELRKRPRVEQFRVMVLESFLLRHCLVTHFAERRVLEELMRTEGIAFEVVRFEESKSERKKRKRREKKEKKERKLRDSLKRRRRTEDETADSREEHSDSDDHFTFAGYRFGASDATVYAPRDVVYDYLPSLCVRRWLANL